MNSCSPRLIVVLILLGSVLFPMPTHAESARPSALRCLADPLLFWLATPKECKEEIGFKSPVVESSISYIPTKIETLAVSTPIYSSNEAKTLTTTPAVMGAVTYREPVASSSNAIETRIIHEFTPGVSKAELDASIRLLRNELLAMPRQGGYTNLYSGFSGGYSYNPDGASKKFVMDEITAVSAIAQAAYDLASTTAGTTGSSTPGQWGTNGSALYYTAGNVGVGTTDPQVALDVSSGSPTGALRIGADISANTKTVSVRKIGRIVAPTYGSATTSFFGLGFDSTATDNIVQVGGNPGAALNGATAISFSTVPTQGTNGGFVAMYINGTQNIGMGLTPGTTHKLHIRQAANQLRLDVDASNGLSVSADSVGLSTFTVNGTGAAFAFMGGNVSVGTTTVDSRFHVSGTSTSVMRMSNSSNPESDMLVGVTGDTTFAGLRIQPSFGNKQSALAIVPSGTGTSSVIQLSNGSSSWYTRSIAGLGYMISGGSVTAPPFFISNAGLVGVGTTTPGTTVHVVGNGVASANLTLEDTRSGAASGAAVLFANAEGTYAGIGDAASGRKHLSLWTDTGTSTIDFFTNGQNKTSAVPRLRIDEFGNIGMATNTPAARFSITGQSGSTTDLFVVASSTNARYLTLSSVGNFGLGTSSPGSKLSVAGDIDVTGALRTNGNAGTSGYVLQTTGTGVQWVATSTLGITSSGGGGSVSNGYVPAWSGASFINSTFISNGTVAGVNATSSTYTFNIQGNPGTEALNVASSTGTSLFVISNGGNVGIGSTTPSSKLTVSGGDIRIDDTVSRGIKLLRNGLAVGDITTASNRFSIQDRIGDGMEFYGASGTAASPFIRILGSGEVGIGTTTPTSRLSVAGDLNLTGALRVSGNSGTAGQVLQSTGTGAQWVATSTLGITSSGGGGGSVSNGYVPRWDGSTFLNATLLDNGTVAGINATSSLYSFNIQGASGINPFNISSSTGTSLFVVNSLGYVGIGTSTPEFPFHIFASNINGSVDSVANDMVIEGLNPGMTFLTGNNNTARINFANTSDADVGYIEYDTNLNRLTLGANAQGSHRFAATSYQLRSNNSSAATIGAYGGNLSGDATFLLYADDGDDATDKWAISASGATNDLNFTNNSISRLYITNAGNIGIGTTTPVARLAVQGQAGSTTDLFVIASSSNSKYLTVTSSGNVGIGTSTDQYKAAVNGTLAVIGDVSIGVGDRTASNYKINFNRGNNSGYARLLYQTDGIEVGAIGLRGDAPIPNSMTFDFYGVHGITIAPPSGYAGGVAPAYAYVGIGNEAKNPKSQLSVGGGATIGISYATTTASPSNGLLVEGNVGIGTTSPGSQLTVAGDINFTGALRTNGNAGTSGYVLQSTGTGATWVATSTLGITGGGGGSGTVNAGTTGQIAFYSADGTAVSGTSTLFIANGNIGVGTTSPLAKFDIYGTPGSSDIFAISSSTNTRLITVTSAGSLGIGSSTPSAKLAITANTGNGDIFAIGTATSSRLLTVSSTGNLGLGAGAAASSPTSLITLGSGYANTKVAFYDAGGALQGIGVQNGDFRFHTDGIGTNFSFRAGAAGTALVTFRGGGDVGIGTTTPAAKLAVAGTAGTRDIFTLASSTNARFFTVTYNGNVGIGTSSPVSLLSVAGAINSTDLLGGATTLSTDANGNIIRTPSDQTLKKDITPISGALDKVLQLQGVTYNWIDSSRFGTEREMGLIAQQIEPIVPEVVKSGGTYKSVNYQNLVALLIEAIKDLSNKVEPVLAWFKDGDFVVQKNICVDDVCVSKDRFKQILMDPTIGGGITYTAPVIENPVTETPTSTSTSTPNVEVPAPEISSSTPPTEETVVPEEPITPAPEAPEIMPE